MRGKGGVWLNRLPSTTKGAIVKKLSHSQYFDFMHLEVVEFNGRVVEPDMTDKEKGAV